MTRKMEDILDCLIVGGGPAGLTAAIYLGRFHLCVEVIDAGNSRASLIPLTRNHAGFPDGIAGSELLARMRDQAAKYGARITSGTVLSLSKRDDGLFVVTTKETGDRVARSILLATGVVNIRPDIPADIHAAAVENGLLRYCPICDGYEVTDKRIAVYGGGERGGKEALFLRSYSADVTLLLPIGEPRPGPHIAERLEAAAILTIADVPDRFRFQSDAILIDTPDGALRFDTLYPALGSDIRSELAATLGADRSEEGCLTVDTHQRTSVPGLYAAGDVVLGLDQISHAMGEGGVAATTIRNDLDERKPNWR